MIKETKYTQGINSGVYSNDNMASDFSTPQSHTINDGSNVINKVCCVWGALSSGSIDYTLSHNTYLDHTVIDDVL